MREPDAVLVEAAISYRAAGKVDEAETYFRKALERNPKSWRAHREYAELLRDQQSIGAALDHYAAAADCVPEHGNDRALVFREWGMLLRMSGGPDAYAKAVEKFEIARRATPNDAILAHALAACYVRLDQFRKAIPILDALVTSNSAETRARSYDLLERCYKGTHDALKLAELKEARAADHEATLVRPRSKRTVEGSSRPLVPSRPDGYKQRRNRR